MCQKNEIFIIKKKFKFIQKKINFYNIPYINSSNFLNLITKNDLSNPQ